MRTLPPLKTEEPGWEAPTEMQEELPGRTRRNFLNWRSAALFAVIVGAAGFYAGIRVEKGQTSSSSSGARAFPFASARTGAGASGTATGARSGASARSGAASGAPTGAPSGGGLPGAGTFAGAGGGSASFGTVSSISGNTLYLTDASGNTVKVRLSSATQITKTVKAPKKSVRPGDTVVVSGLANKQGTVAATTVRDSGASGAGSASGSSSGSSGGSSTSGSSAVRSLFGSGG